MRITSALFTGGILAASISLLPFGTAVTATAATPDHAGGSHGSGVRGTVVSAGVLNLRQQPTTDSPVVGQLAPGSRGRVLCSVLGQTVRGNPHWYWLKGVDAWASAAFIDTGGRSVPRCSDPCPQWKDGGDTHWSVSGTWSFNLDVTFG
ncbi:SH3 domain-containing protein [Streptomyces sp. NBC_01538]|uniref:SH3 domain-containing protein n=1 Tax=Streptomyces sp. NBC_01538 TaxID=2903897 RepID=UPI00386CDF43